MNTEDFSHYQDLVVTAATEVGFKILAAVAFWLIGRWLIGLTVNLLRGSLERQKVDSTVLRYVGSIVTVTLNVLLVIGILGYFGIQTTTFAALIAAAGVAIGMAWSGLLAHFAAGAFLVVLRPMKVGDFVSVAGVTGTVVELGLFTTVINTPDNIQTIIGNNKIFSDTIQKVAAIPNVLSEPPVDIEILDFTLVGPVLAVRPYCHNDHYWQVYFDTNRVLREALGEAGFPAPMPAQNVIVTQGV
jgi:small conductance mechanosensitive channel